MSGRRLYWALSGFLLYLFAAYGISRRVAPTILNDAPVEPNVIFLTLVIIGLVCAVACYFAVGPDRDRRK